MQKLAELKNELDEIYYELFYNEQKHYLYANWIGFSSSQDIVDGATVLMHWLEQNRDKNVSCYINDNRQFKGTWGVEMQWVTEVWTPAVYNSGLRYCALVLSQDIFAQMAAAAFDEASAEVGKLTTRMFNTFEEAEKWVDEKNRVNV
ncbi:hypothetical protein [Polluticoccus soli]|uniref:hypothetical protein n=1 Tax=Polluticoccus soli TaxID=3034150 RepID=UPI0023E0FA6D|nr:hypothetical protein [Flavipsychrobacter sp. JY13-12]